MDIFYSVLSNRLNKQYAFENASLHLLLISIIICFNWLFLKVLQHGDGASRRKPRKTAACCTCYPSVNQQRQSTEGTRCTKAAVIRYTHVNYHTHTHSVRPWTLIWKVRLRILLQSPSWPYTCTELCGYAVMSAYKVQVLFKDSAWQRDQLKLKIWHAPELSNKPNCAVITDELDIVFL